MKHQAPTPSIVMIGATGAVGTETASHLLAEALASRLTLLGRREWKGPHAARAQQHIVDVLDTSTYESLLPGHTAAICTLGVGQPSTMSREQFVRIDKDAVFDFAVACKAAGVRHFSLLGSIGSDASSRSFFLARKGELQDALIELGFDRLSLFQPSMILTPENRYGWSQAITLKAWPWLKWVLLGPLRKYRGVLVEDLGAAIAINACRYGRGLEILRWDDFVELRAASRVTSAP